MGNYLQHHILHRLDVQNIEHTALQLADILKVNVEYGFYCYSEQLITETEYTKGWNCIGVTPTTYKDLYLLNSENEECRISLEKYGKEKLIEQYGEWEIEAFDYTFDLKETSSNQRGKYDFWIRNGYLDIFTIYFHIKWYYFWKSFSGIDDMYIDEFFKEFNNSRKELKDFAQLFGEDKAFYLDENGACLNEQCFEPFDYYNKADIEAFFQQKEDKVNISQFMLDKNYREQTIQYYVEQKRLPDLYVDDFSDLG